MIEVDAIILDDSAVGIPSVMIDTAVVRTRRGEGRMTEVAVRFLVGHGIYKDDGCAVTDFRLGGISNSE